MFIYQTPTYQVLLGDQKRVFSPSHKVAGNADVQPFPAAASSLQMFS